MLLVVLDFGCVGEVVSLVWVGCEVEVVGWCWYVDLGVWVVVVLLGVVNVGGLFDDEEVVDVGVL